MARIKQTSFHIDRSSFAVGSVCSIHYEYFLSFEPEEIGKDDEYIVFCELWGINSVREKRLNDEIYDAHRLKATYSIDQSRYFAVNCELLNEKLGEDHLFIQIILQKNGQIHDTVKSDTVSDSF